MSMSYIHIFGSVLLFFEKFEVLIKILESFWYLKKV